MRPTSEAEPPGQQGSRAEEPPALPESEAEHIVLRGGCQGCLIGFMLPTLLIYLLLPSGGQAQAELVTIPCGILGLILGAVGAAKQRYRDTNAD